MNTDAIDRLACLRPAPTLAAEECSSMLATIIGSDPAAGRTRVHALNRPPARRRRLAFAVGTVAVAGVIVFAAGSSTRVGSQAAFAGWTAVPTPATTAQIARAQALCRTISAPPAGSRVVVAERRGPSDFLVFASALVSSDCLLEHPDDAGPESGVGGAGGGVDPDAAAMLRPGGADVDELDGFGQSGARLTELAGVYGRSGPDVRKIVVQRADGRTVTAEVTADGWWSAWWPGDDLTPRQLVVTATDGSVHEVSGDSSRR